jgi:cyclin-dependent kinase 7
LFSCLPWSISLSNLKPSIYIPHPGKRLGKGTFALVYRGHLRSNPQHLVAIKKFKIPSQPEQRSEGLNVDSIRETKYLQELSHPSIVALLDVFST